MRLMLLLILVLIAHSAIAETLKISDQHKAYDLGLEQSVLKKMKLQYTWRTKAYTQTTTYDVGKNTTVVATFIAGFVVTNNGGHSIDSVKFTCRFFDAPGDTQSIDGAAMTQHGLIKSGETKNFPETQMGSVLTERAFAALERGVKPECRIENIHLAE